MEIIGVTESTVRFLRQEIVTGQIPPGAKLNETELSNRFGVSRPPLREAFRKLEYENLVSNIPRKGTFVTDISIEDCKQLYFIRRVLECAAIDVIAENRHCDFSDIRRAIEAGKSATIPRHADPIDLINYYDNVAGFHWQIVEASENQWLIHCYRSISATLARYQIMYLAISGTRQRSIESHTETLHLLEDGKYQDAKDHLVAHIMQTLQKLIEKMHKDPVVCRKMT
jgi:DNA-binding GntR family transcriptional regulator